MKTESLTVTVNCKTLAKKAAKVAKYTDKLQRAIEELAEATASIQFDKK